eukprot:gnl/TRDRNA2_/TRDRNA2_195171_c0_seq1.p1 gnl/TRDRNA2_/TRDRNA2_195171_c0~~gnl/TRDRNA2_/TRDRNA2_195171_c0_seq1.p1  ORF type:complete len:377 (+),score=84.38 gnl/TRDRNA2_/TRDRNA2_195171_c0_seq1:55-1185(+)
MLAFAVLKATALKLIFNSCFLQEASGEDESHAGGPVAAAAELQRGLQLARNGKISEAYLAFELVVEYDPLGPAAKDAYWQLGQIHFAGGARDMAEEAFARYYEADLEKSVLERYNFHGTPEELAARLKEEADYADTKASDEAWAPVRRHLQRIRAKEGDPQWLASTFLDCHVQAAAGGAGYQACAYGVTWLDSFVKVLEAAPLSHILAAPKLRIVVLGSALGYQCAWLVALHPNARCVGIEMLTGLATEAAKLLEEQDGTGEGNFSARARFECRDALGPDRWWDKTASGAPEDGPLLVWANDYSWGPGTRERLFKKAADEAALEAKGAVLIVPKLDAENVMPPAGWLESGTASVPASWVSALTLAIYEVPGARVEL